MLSNLNVIPVRYFLLAGMTKLQAREFNNECASQTTQQSDDNNNDLH